MAPHLHGFCECVSGDEALLITAETLSAAFQHKKNPLKHSGLCNVVI